MASLVNRKALAKAAGLSGSETAQPASKFKLVASQTIAGITAGDTLTTKKHAVLYVRALINDDLGEGQETTLSDDQIWEGIKQFDQADLEPVDIDQGIVDYLNALASTLQSPLPDKQEQDLLNASKWWAEAKRLGEAAPKELETTVDTAIEGKKLWDGGPIMIESALVKAYGKESMAKWPIVGTRLTGKRNNKGQSTDNVDPGYNHPTDYAMITVGGESTQKRWWQGYVEAMPHVHIFVTERKTVKALIDNVPQAIVPQKYVNLTGPQLWGVHNDLTAEITKRVNRITQAAAYFQAKAAMDEHLPNIRHSLTDEDINVASKRTKPIQMFELRPDPVSKQVMPWPQAKPIALSKFIRHGKNAAVCKTRGATLAKLDEMSTAKKKPTPPATVGSATSVTSYKIENVNAMSSALAGLYDYVKHHEPMIKDKIKETATGEEFCSWLMNAYKALEGIIEGDKALFELIQTRAKAYDQRETAAVNAAFKAAEAAKAAADKAA